MFSKRYKTAVNFEFSNVRSHYINLRNFKENHDLRGSAYCALRPFLAGIPCSSGRRRGGGSGQGRARSRGERRRRRSGERPSHPGEVQRLRLRWSRRRLRQEVQAGEARLCARPRPRGGARAGSRERRDGRPIAGPLFLPAWFEIPGHLTAHAAAIPCELSWSSVAALGAVRSRSWTSTPGPWERSP